jgi:hypothetical protein
MYPNLAKSSLCMIRTPPTSQNWKEKKKKKHLELNMKYRCLTTFYIYGYTLKIMLRVLLCLGEFVLVT